MDEGSYEEVGSFKLSELDGEVEMMVDIYESVDTIRPQTREDIQQTNTDTAKKTKQTGSGCYRLTTVGLVLLCSLLLVSNIVLLMNYVNVKEDKEGLVQIMQSQSVNFTLEQEKLKSCKINLTEQITKQRNYQIHFQFLNREIIKINTSYKNLNKRYTELSKNHANVLKKLGWSKFGKKYYYISTEKKSWSDSRAFCRERGSDLVIINNREEQSYFQKKGIEVWIGLTDAESEGKWMWVDGTPLTTAFWNNREPNNVDGNENCAHMIVLPRSLNNWNDINCLSAENWICEFSLSS